jgi:hypothetical protein
MIRFIVRETDIGAACNVGGPPVIKFKTFYEDELLEKYLRFSGMTENDRKYLSRELIGCELIKVIDE